MNERKRNHMKTNDKSNWQGHLAMANTPTIAEERWRIVDEGDRWIVWFIPQNYPERWRELGDFPTEREAVEYLKSI